MSTAFVLWGYWIGFILVGGWIGYASEDRNLPELDKLSAILITILWPFIPLYVLSAAFGGMVRIIVDRYNE